MDTRVDHRILMAEDAIDRLERRVKNWGLTWPLNKKRASETLKEIRKTLKRIRYSFLPAKLLAQSEDTLRLVFLSRTLSEVLLPKPGFQLPRSTSSRLALAEIRYSLSVLIGLPMRLRLGEKNLPEYAVDVFGVEVTRVDNLSGILMVTRASARSFALTIVTNIKDIRTEEVRAAAILPPLELQGVISEAMYASGPIDGKYIGKRVPSSMVSGEVASRVIEITSQYSK